MGVAKAHDNTHSIDDLSKDQLINIIKQRYEKCSIKKQYRNKPIVDIDASWIVRKAYDQSKEDRINYLFNICFILIKENIDVLIICDGPDRHHSKRATIRRAAEVQKNKIKLILNKTKLARLTSERRATSSVQRKQEIQKEGEELAKETNKLEKKLQDTLFDVGTSLLEAIQQKIATIENDDESFGTINVVQTVFQAYSLLAYRCVRGLSDMMFANDSDQAALCGKECCSVKEFNNSFDETSIFLRMKQHFVM